jgi:uncharacterized RDD family membrane protein YckC
MKWYYADQGKQVGPVEEPALDDLVRTGVVRDDTLVWREGMAAWQPLSAARPRPSTPPAGPAVTPVAAVPVAAAQGYCVECGRPFPMSEMAAIGGAPVCANCRPAYMQRASGSGRGLGQWRYAGFWIRFLARIIDVIILVVVGTIIRLPLMVMFGLSARESGAAAVAILPAAMALAGVLTLINIAIAVAYEVYFVSTKGGTVGKMILGLKIIRADGGPVSAGLATARYFAQWISGIILMIGYIMAGLDIEKRSLHDRICNTRVIYAR